MTSLTRAEAEARAGLIAVESCAIELDLDQGPLHFTSTSCLRFTCSQPGASTFVDVDPDALHSATLNGVEIDPATHFDAGRLRLDGLAAANELTVHARMAYSHDGEGLHRHVDPADGEVYLYAMSFLDAAPRWFACFDQPDLKALVSIDVTCPPDWRVAGNGPATELAPGRWHVAATGRLATYFVTLVAGRYYTLTGEHDGIPLALHVRRSLAGHLDRHAAELFAHTRHCLDRLHALFGVRYPWGEYHQAFVPEFNAGAMENPGCVTLRDDLVYRSRATDADHEARATTIAHEMAHMWFGDLVTMRWWDDLWLNESFAEYLGHRVIGEQTWAGFGIERKSWGYRADRRPSTHPVAGNGALDAASALNDFDGISYAKGASALRQLGVHLGDEIFLRGLHTYIAGHASGNAELTDLLDAWRGAGAVDLDRWTQAWLRTTGLDTLATSGTSVVRSGPTPRPHTVRVAGLARDGRQEWTRTVTLDGAQTTLDAPAAELVIPDALDETWAKIALSPEDWERMGETLPGVEETRTRVAIWNALILAAADAEVDPALAARIVTAALPYETSDAVVTLVGEWALRTVAGAYLDDADRPAPLASLSDGLREVVHGAAPESGRQLAAARLFVAATTEDALLEDWLEQRRLPDGLVLDADLRWAVLLRLAERDRIDPARIADEAAADRSTSGAVHAARCRSARPDPAGKAEAWTALMTDAERSNYELYALAEGFWLPGQHELTAPYVERYFAEVPATATLRSGWVIERLALLAYPRTAVDEATVSATEALVADPALHAGIRRSAVDAGDDLRRAVAVRRRFGR